jgi:hypothetical protein
LKRKKTAVEKQILIARVARADATLNPCFSLKDEAGFIDLVGKTTTEKTNEQPPQEVCWNKRP